MTVKAKVGRPRHVALALAGRWSRGALQDALKRAEPAAQLTRFDGAFALARVPHARAREARAAFASLTGPGGARATPIGTAGTVRAAVEKFAPSLARKAGAARASGRGPKPDRDL